MSTFWKESTKQKEKKERKRIREEEEDAKEVAFNEANNIEETKEERKLRRKLAKEQKLLLEENELKEKKHKKKKSKVQESDNNSDNDDDVKIEVKKVKKLVVEDKEGKVIVEQAVNKLNRKERRALLQKEMPTEAVLNNDDQESHELSNAPTDAKEQWKTGEQLWKEGTLDDDYLRSNPDKITRLFCGNLNKKVTQEELQKCIEGITFIKWITDKETKEFYGSTFIECKDAKSAAEAVSKDKQKFMGRPLKIYYCPPRPGDTWPPHGGVSTNRGGGISAQPPRREKTVKPTNCKKLYMGNLSYNIDDDACVDFFKDCGEMVGLRWLTRKGTEEFRGCGFVEFYNTEAAEEAIKLDGKELLGRPIRLDWTE
jgi:nucleolin